MSSFVIVTDARNRQYKIQTTPAKPLTEILQEVCKRAEVDATQHTLKHGKHLLDCSLTIRLAGLPAGAKLDLVVASKRIAFVNIALDVAGAIRLKASCLASSTLWDVLCTFEQQGVRLIERAAQTDAYRRAQPILTINNRMFESDAVLRETTLAALGIQQGSAVIKVAFRDTQELLPERIRDAPLAEPVMQQAAIAVPGIMQTPATLPASLQATASIPSEQPIDRQMVILRPSQDAQPVYANTPDEDPHTPSIDQAKRYLSLLQQPNKASQEPLMTRAQREAAAALVTQRTTLPTILKFKFRFSSQVAGGVQVLAEFSPGEVTASLYDFIASLLLEGQENAFGLETGYPDRRLLPRYAPGSLRLLGFGAATALQVVPAGASPLTLREEVLSQAVEAREHVEKRRVQEELEDAKEAESMASTKTTKDTSTKEPSSHGAKKVPKWLKMGKR
ncbi:GLUT4 regulating protein TUG-domain-containing protein [Protomyces lactucae-debilis]|uniref:GLUT4 regulating protein TUG-domain-containing protein n=1 Tax=Protomyces lactucae-debilis TaxID=2754530 RepID=A0A1Y2F2P5_PROLT|nr:GLUT4 regulating protein TUG-domain-containing protein [Protomyces lactucae-debilis]ORY77754.1 GLUT4 regulating protein TUG-domain-containing protein [Protomyces lactucae-debilis]